MILVIAEREWRAFLLTARGWIMLAASEWVLAWQLLRALDPFVGPEAPASGLHAVLVSQVFGAGAAVLLLIAPLLAARALSGERRDGTLTLLLSAPASPLQLALGKWLGLLLPVLLIGLWPLALCLLLLGAAPLDFGHLLAATLGLWLAGGLFLAVGLCLASVSQQPTMVTVLACGLLLLLSALHRPTAGAAFSPLAWLSWSAHLQAFWDGLVRFSDLLYFFSVTMFCLALAQRALDLRRG